MDNVPFSIELIELLIELFLQLQFQALGGILPPPRKVANLLYSVGSKMKVNTEKYIPLMVEYIMEEKIDTDQRVTGN